VQLVPTRRGKVAVGVAGEGIPLVLLHATGHGRHDFDAILPLVPKQFQTIAVDWPGHGESEMFVPPSSASVEAMGEVLEDVVGELKLPPAVLLGNSVGGTASLRLAIRSPERVRALVLVDTGGLVESTPTSRAFCWLQGKVSVRRSVGLRFARWYLKRRGPGVEALLRRIEETRARPGFFEMEAAMWRSFSTPANDMSREAGAISCPILLVWGKHDPIIRAAIEGKRAREILARAQYVELDTGHTPFVEDPGAFLGAVAPFLSELRP
jgi:3-oxoadipate enol-lactonase